MPEVEEIVLISKEVFEGGKVRQSKVEKQNQKAPEDVTSIREKTYTSMHRMEMRKPRFYQQSSAMLIMLAVAEHP